METLEPPSPPVRRSLWRHRDFMLVWLGQSASMFGSTVSFIALPLIGVLLLELSAFEMGLVATASTVPGVLLSPFSGTIVDRVDRRRLMIGADLGRALLIVSIPLATLFGVLSMAQLIVVGGGLAVLTRLFNLAHMTFLPSVVEEESLADGNSKLEASQSVADVSGPGAAGLLVTAVGPAVTVLVDAGSYVVSAVSLARVRFSSAASAAVKPRGRSLKGFWRDTVTGFRLMWTDEVLRSISVSYASLALFAQIQMVVYMLFLVRNLHFPPIVIGLVFALSGVVGFGAALLGGRLAGTLGVGRLLVLGQGAMVAGGVLLASVAGSTVQAAGTMLVAEAFFAIGMSFWGVGSRTLFQIRTADEVRGRVIGASGVLTGVLVACSGLLGGALGSAFGLRTALVIGAVGMLLSLALVLRRRVWMVHLDKTKVGQA
ncbi:MFS transporter [Phytomonospora endophytica]|nr:MFS transporter [Phytomonospora endophytica]